jgi:hypothetical protein
MHTLHVIVVSLALIVATAIAGAAWVSKDRYEFVTTSGNNVIWKLDRLTGQAYGCEESEFGPFCIPAPNQIKHAE